MPASRKTAPPASKDHASAAPILLHEQQGAVAILTLNRPEARNALSEAMLASLMEAISRVGSDKNTHAVVLTANGPAFSSGHDLKELTGHRTDADNGRAHYRAIMEKCAAVMQAVVACPKPVIAAIETTATAAGCQLVATCDLAVAGDHAQFCTPGVNIGLFCSTPMVALSRNISRKRAMEMLLLGDMLDARSAADYGLVNRVVPAGQARAAAIRMAEVIAAKSPATVAVGKATFYRQIEVPLAAAYQDAANVMVENMLFADAEEGIGAFLGKRPAKWRGC